MDSYQSQFAYAPGADASYMRYPSMGMTPMMAPMNVPPPPPPVFDSFHQAGITQLPCSSRIGSKSSPCSIYRHDGATGITSEHRAEQVCMADGRLFIEHIPNHSLVYIPLSSSIDQVLYSLQHRECAPKPAQPQPQPQLPRGSSASRQSAQPQAKKPAAPQNQQPAPRPQSQPQSQPRKYKEKSAKPINAFIKYRSYKIAELKRLHPEVSQTDISRLAGECWKTESEDIKNQFRVQYMEEKKVYDMKKAINASNKRSRDAASLSDSSAPSKKDQSSNSDIASAPLPGDIAVGSVGVAPAALNLPADFDSALRRRSLTLPSPTTASIARAASASPLMMSQNQPSAKRRRCVTTDLRKQLAAKSSSLLAMSPPLQAAAAAAAAAAATEAVAGVSAEPGSVPFIRAQSMGVHESFGEQQGSQDYNSGMYYYDALSLASSINEASPQLLGLSGSVHSNSPYLDDMGAMAPLPIAPSFSMPWLPPPQQPHQGDALGLSVETSFVSATSADDPSSNAFDLYTTGSDHEELASSLVSASLVAASLSTMMASSQPAVDVHGSMPEAALGPTAVPVADVSSGYFHS
ncbi:hypothetical protein GGF46_001779 [Coemansia sp. RSA 552]|nr:hypothetical protein GGF46_001779 [Coemansia sp. RSA 552]